MGRPPATKNARIGHEYVHSTIDDHWHSAIYRGATHPLPEQYWPRVLHMSPPCPSQLQRVRHHPLPSAQVVDQGHHVLRDGLIGGDDGENTSLVVVAINAAHEREGI